MRAELMNFKEKERTIENMLMFAVNWFGGMVGNGGSNMARPQPTGQLPPEKQSMAS